MFSYLYYRYYQHYIRGKETDKIARFSASIALVITQFFMFLCALLTIEVFVDTSGFRENYSWLIAPLFLALGSLLILFNHKRYANKTESIVERFKNSPINKWLKIWMIIASSFILLLLPFVLSSIIH